MNASFFYAIYGFRSRQLCVRNVNSDLKEEKFVLKCDARKSKLDHLRQVRCHPPQSKGDESAHTRQPEALKDIPFLLLLRTAADSNAKVQVFGETSPTPPGLAPRRGKGGRHQDRAKLYRQITTRLPVGDGGSTCFAASDPHRRRKRESESLPQF
jgi:hypothetical protein